MKFNGVLRFIISAIIIGVIIAASVNHFWRPHDQVTLKTNRIKQIITTRQHVLGNLWQAATIYFWNKYLPEWHKGYEPSSEQKKQIHKLLHYNPHIEHIVDSRPTQFNNHKRPTIFYHGWGDTKNSAKLMKAYGDVLPGDLITFHFRDRGVILPKLRHANLGQLPDVLSGLVVLKWAKDTMDLDTVDLYGYSRGGATILNTLAVLNDKTGAYDTDLMRIGIDTQERKKLLSIIQNGSIVLDAPLTDMNVSINEKLKNHSKTAVKALSRLTHYQPYGLQGLTSAHQLDGLKLNILLHFQYKDRIVSNKNEAELYQALYEHNPKTTYIVLGNDGGHLHTHASLAHVIHTFRKMFGGSYDRDYDAQYHATKSRKKIEAMLLQPGKKVREVIDGYYARCAKE